MHHTLSDIFITIKLHSQTMPLTSYAQKLVAYMTQQGYQLFRQPGEINILYVEGASLDGTPNTDEQDRFNDLGLLLRFNDAGVPEIIHRAVCTTEPGTLATFSTQAMQMGGVARVQLTQYQNCWQLGFHKSNRAHPALVQCALMLVHRDRNRDFKRTGDPLMPAWGVNHHGTRPGYVAKVVGMFSFGCSVRLYWKDHLEFIELLRTDPRYVANSGFRFSAAYLDGRKVWAVT